MSDARNFVFTSESVSEGHPDKVADYISDSVLDACLTQDRKSRVACETLCKNNTVVLAGEITANAHLNFDEIVRRAVREIGYVHPEDSFNADSLQICQFITKQAPEISTAVDNGKDLGAGDQGIMFGYATNETPELMPLPINLAHRLARLMAEDRKSGKAPWLRPDSKTQVSVRYEGGKPVQIETVVVSTQHERGFSQSAIRDYVITQLAPRALGEWFHDGLTFFVNPSGSFELGGPTADCGLTGRKIIVDTYGGAAHHGGGAFSGKDASKVDRSGAYFGRFVARQIVKQGLAERAELQVAYAIGVAQPVSVKVETFGTGDAAAAEEFVRTFDFRPAAIIERLQLDQPFFRQTTNYGHFGKPELPWEA